jgi:alkanesulfonate monooxygenase SsuD/methylene tetrahydromethanopterin reductase-like flavin-dependent oxidoreductase (luciferase family)
VHDTTWFEINGRPAVFIASSEFAQAADAQARALGLPDVHRVIVPHPIQDATDDEMRAKADAIVEQVIAALTQKS